MILITGASGTVGRTVLSEVARTGKAHRAMYRSKKDAAKAPSGTETVIADFADKSSLAAALRGVESVYLVCSPIPDLPQLESNMIDACQSAGVRRIVLNSALGAGDYPKSFPAWHRKVEDKLRARNFSRFVCLVRWTVPNPAGRRDGPEFVPPNGPTRSHGTRRTPPEGCGQPCRRGK